MTKHASLIVLLALAVAAPARAEIATKIYAQQLIDETAARHPELRVIAIHAIPPKGSDDVIIASNIGRIGRKPVPDELGAVEVVLKDTSGVNVGALEVADAGADRAALRQKAEQIRDRLARRILNAGNLFDPYPMDPAATTKTHAQKLVDQAMARHPDVLSLAMHVTLPGGSDNIILGSSFGRIGKKADEDDMKVIRTGAAIPGIYAAGKRFGLELVLQNAAGATIGALSVAYPYAAGADQAALQKRAEQLRDELRTQIDSVEQLVRLDPFAPGADSAANAQAAHAAVYVPARYDLSALPSYKPEGLALGVLRIYGTPLEALVGRWATEFRAKQGHVRLHAYLINTSQAFAGLVSGQADIGLMGHRTWHTPLMAFHETFGYDPLEIRFASGSYDDPEGTTPGLMFIVHQSNPLANLTLDQIDGIFGAQRTGGWAGTTWATQAARGPERNIRTWGQLGLTGAWADKPIHPRGSDVTLSNWADLIERVAFHGGTKWNPALYEGPRADISWKAHGKTRDQQIVEGVQNDPLAIGFMFQRVINATHADVKVLPLAEKSGGPYVVPSAQSFFDGSYPMHNGAYLYVNRAPGHPLPALEREFVRFVLSREGQQIIADSRLFIPLSAAQAQAELAKLK